MRMELLGSLQQSKYRHTCLIVVDSLLRMSIATHHDPVDVTGMYSMRLPRLPAPKSRKSDVQSILHSFLLHDYYTRLHLKVSQSTRLEMLESF